MNKLTTSQEYFFRSIVNNSLKNEDEPVRLAVESPGQQSILLVLQQKEEGVEWEIVDYSKKQSLSVSLEEGGNQILAQLSASGGTLLIDRGETVQRASLQAGKIVRETIEKQPAILKQPSWAVGKTTHIDPSRAADLLQTIGLMTPQGEIKAPMRKKFKQVNHFIELLLPFLPEKTRKKPFTIVDCGCGKSYLGFVLFWYVRNVLKCPALFYGIDSAQDRIDHCLKQAGQLNLKNMNFECASNRAANLPDRIDLLIALHACDTATDEALALGVARNAKFIAAAPCCQHEIANQLEGIPEYPLTKHGIFKHRYADLLTDMLRCLFLESHGYSVTAGEFVSVVDTPKNLLIRARQGNQNAAQRLTEYENFKRHYTLNPSIDMLLLELQAGNG